LISMVESPFSMIGLADDMTGGYSKSRT